MASRQRSGKAQGAEVSPQPQPGTGAQVPQVKDNFLEQMDKQSGVQLGEIVIELPQTGKPMGKAIVTDIQQGKVADFLTQRQLDAIMTRLPHDRAQQYLEKPAVRVTFTTADTGQSFVKIFTISYNRNSKLYAFLKRYGVLKKGLEVEYTINERGFLDVVM